MYMELIEGTLGVLLGNLRVLGDAGKLFEGTEGYVAIIRGTTGVLGGT